MKVLPVTLEGQTVRLEPLSAKHAAGLAKHTDTDFFKLFPGPMPGSSQIEEWEEFVRQRQSSGDVCFAMVLKETGETIGHTCYLDIRPLQRGLEIGGTWIATAYQGGKVNPECKLLMLTHAFEKLGCIRVQLKTDERNLRSQRAIEKLGAKKEGVLRKQFVMQDGFHRNSVMYSITDEEWPEVKKRLLERLSG